MLVPSEEIVIPYVAQTDNYTPDLWDAWCDFRGEASEFPINRKTTYNLERFSNGKEYKDYFFTAYDEANDNLVFRKHNGDTFDYCTIADVDDWEITYQNVVLGS